MVERSLPDFYVLVIFIGWVYSNFDALAEPESSLPEVASEKGQAFALSDAGETEAMRCLLVEVDITDVMAVYFVYLIFDLIDFWAEFRTLSQLDKIFAFWHVLKPLLVSRKLTKREFRLPRSNKGKEFLDEGLFITGE